MGGDELTWKLHFPDRPRTSRNDWFRADEVEEAWVQPAFASAAASVPELVSTNPDVPPTLQRQPSSPIECSVALNF